MSEQAKGVSRYPHIFAPGKIGRLEIKNRTVMAAMGCSASPSGYVNDAVINHYVERAKGGVGLIIVEVTCVDAPQGLNSADMLRIDHDHFIPGMTRLAKAIHDHGAKCLLQISHTGRGAKRKVSGLQPVGPSAVPMPMLYVVGVENETPRVLTVPEIERIEDKYAEAAKRALRAGFDGVEVHSTGYYLGCQFLSKSANLRTDEYGGTPEKRILFHQNLLQKIRANCGDDFTVAIKATLVQGEDIPFEDGAYFAVRFAQMGYDALEVMAGSSKPMPTYEDLPFTDGPECSMLGLSKTFKDIVAQQVPGSAMQFIAGGRAYDPAVIEPSLAQGMSDFVVMGKGLFAEPRLINYIREDRIDEIRPCIGCTLCMNIQLDTGEAGRCSGNAVAGRGDQSYDLTPASPPKKIVVVGGGVAGMEAARIAAKRGHQVTLYERAPELGGQLIDAIAPPHKAFMKRLLPYYQRQLEVTGVETVLGKEVTADALIAQKPDAVICATGVSPAKLPIPGFEKPHVVNAKDVLRERVQPGKKVVIIGGGVVGCETAEFLAQKGVEVAIVEMTDKLAARMLFGNQCVLLAHLEHHGLTTHLESRCVEIKDDGVVIEQKDGKTLTEPCDTVVVSVGDRADHHLADQLEGKVPFVQNIGDSYLPDSIAESVAAGYYAGAMV